MKAKLTAIILLIGFQAAPAIAEMTLNDAVIKNDVWHKMVMPAETLKIEIEPGMRAEIDGEQIDGRWTAPGQAGSHVLKVYDIFSQEHHHVTLFVLEPKSSISERGYIGKYRIGHYPRNTPKGFIKLSEEDRDLPVSKNFTVGQFLCKQQPGVWPKYLIVSEDNLTRLEALLKFVRETHDETAETLFVMSGYRTPFYNTAIGSAKYSRHMYGDAADVYVDTKPRDGRMDDLNKDGRITKADANFLYDRAQKLFGKPQFKPGGLGSYRANAVRGPFIHVDARGYKARWGR